MGSLKELNQRTELECIRTQIVTDAMELLSEGFPLDNRTMKDLESVGIDYVEFTKRFEIAPDHS